MEKHGLPLNMRLRKPDKEILSSIKDSYVFERTANLLENAINPSLLYFSEELNEFDIGKVLRKLHGDNIEDEV